MGGRKFVRESLVKRKQIEIEQAILALGKLLNEMWCEAPQFQTLSSEYAAMQRKLRLRLDIAASLTELIPLLEEAYELTRRLVAHQQYYLGKKMKVNNTPQWQILANSKSAFWTWREAVQILESSPQHPGMLTKSTLFQIHGLIHRQPVISLDLLLATVWRDKSLSVDFTKALMWEILAVFPLFAVQNNHNNNNIIILINQYFLLSDSLAQSSDLPQFDNLLEFLTLGLNDEPDSDISDNETTIEGSDACCATQSAVLPAPPPETSSASSNSPNSDCQIGRPPKLKSPEILESIQSYIASQGYAAHERRVDDRMHKCGASADDIRQHIMEKFCLDVSTSTVRRTMAAPKKNTHSAKYYKGLIKARLAPNKNEDSHDHGDAHYCFSKVYISPPL